MGAGDLRVDEGAAGALCAVARVADFANTLTKVREQLARLGA